MGEKQIVRTSKDGSPTFALLRGEDSLSHPLGNLGLRDIDMKVYPTFGCGHDCKFCMTDIRYKPNEANTITYLKRFKKSLNRYYRFGGRKVLITGGEPTKAMERILGMLEEAQRYELDLIVLYTNGSRLLETYEYRGKTKKIVEHLYDAGLRHINISVHHYDPKKRQRLLNSDEGVCDIVEVAREVNKRDEMCIRLNCTLMRDYIGDVRGVIDYIGFAKRIGVTDVYFRDLFHLENRALSIRFAEMGKVEFTDNQRINFDGLIRDIKRVPNMQFVKTMSRHVGQGKTILFNYNGVQVWFGTLEIGTENANRFTYFAFMPDGNIYYNMNGPEFQVKS
jgi:molybdenum cofactor biosynthesis enzyme MoaA